MRIAQEGLSSSSRTAVPPAIRELALVTYNRASQGELRERYYADKRSRLAAAAEAGGVSTRLSTIDHFRGKPV